MEHVSQDHLKQAIITALDTSDLHRLVVRAHLTFLSKYYCARWPTETEDIFRSCIWRYLLFTKTQQKLAQQAWKIVGESKLKDLEVLNGCVELVSDAPDNSLMAAINLAVSRKIARTCSRRAKPSLSLLPLLLADNVMISNQYQYQLDFFVSGLKSDDSHPRALACLVLRALLNALSGGQQVDAACRVVENLGLQSMDTFEDVITNGASLGPVSTTLHLPLLRLPRLSADTMP